MATAEIRVSGMSCEGCVRSVTRALGAVPGVEHVDVSLAEEKARLTYDPAKAGLPDFERALERAGYGSS